MMSSAFKFLVKTKITKLNKKNQKKPLNKLILKLLQIEIEKLKLLLNNHKLNLILLEKMELIFSLKELIVNL